MHEQYPDLEATVQRYVLGLLPADEAEQFEAWYLARPEIIEMIETVQNINIGMQSAKLVPSVGADFNRPKAPVTKDSLLQRLSRWLSVPVPAYASLALIALAAPFLINNSGEQLRSQQNLNLVGFSTAQLRGSAASLELDLSSDIAPAALLLKVKSVDYQYYQVQISSLDDSESVWNSQPFEVSALRDHLLLLPDSILTGRKNVEMFGLAPTGEKNSVEFCHYSETCR